MKYFTTLQGLSERLSNLKIGFTIKAYTQNGVMKVYTSNTSDEIVFAMFQSNNHELLLHSETTTYKINILFNHEDDLHAIEMVRV